MYRPNSSANVGDSEHEAQDPERRKVEADDLSPSRIDEVGQRRRHLIVVGKRREAEVVPEVAYGGEVPHFVRPDRSIETYERHEWNHQHRGEHRERKPGARIDGEAKAPGAIG